LSNMSETRNQVKIQPLQLAEDAMKRLLVTSVIALALALRVTGLAVAGGETTLRITISPLFGPAGTAITVNGEGTQADKPVRVSLVVSGETEDTPLVSIEVTPNADGTFQTTLAVPDGTADGAYAVRASQINPATGNEIHYWWVNFWVGAAVPGLPVTGGAECQPDYTLYYALGVLALLVLVYRGLRARG
jgi:hypothetical protein